jgi:hypothetical protein
MLVFVVLYISMIFAVQEGIPMTAIGLGRLGFGWPLFLIFLTVAG